ncbi:glycoprotein-N-acetylgalactosamine 3-beta-galactosyltransferase 1-like [Paramacrobiotus metropolitanus]|uniref:glycoprotein-N-acetylgalactosamine 3-beta-galactosyltransferase 1-like n=1 Tax=Paramacrobiotus metropolitanus TaxID=2943436 RepID=UPI002445E6DF|nr:glycoprotein-N-acetylgalactosamine 3-beta-galactosyltransferase 1-like [Paramacrobiotus metropolitanus]
MYRMQASKRTVTNVSKTFAVCGLVILFSLSLMGDNGSRTPARSSALHSAPPSVFEDIQQDSGGSPLKDFLPAIRILCLILSSPSNQEKAKAVQETWARHCSSYFFVTAENRLVNDSQRILNPGVPEGRDNLWGKTKAAFRHAYNQHLDKYDWFYKADDDTYAIMENMRYMLKNVSRNQAVYYGSHIRSHRVKSDSPRLIDALY